MYFGFVFLVLFQLLTLGVRFMTCNAASHHWVLKTFWAHFEGALTSFLISQSVFSAISSHYDFLLWIDSVQQLATHSQSQSTE